MPYGRGYRRRGYRRSYRGGGRLLKKTAGGKAKEIIDGHKAGWVSSGMKAIPYLVKTVGFLRNMINAEYKYIDTVTTVSPVANTGTVTYLSGIAQGVTDITRIGNKILFKDIMWRMQASINDTALTSALRIIVFSARQVNGVLPTVAEVLQTVSQLAPLNRDNTKQYVIIKDYLWSLNFANDSETKIVKGYHVLNYHANYDGATAAIGDAEENHLFMLCISDDATNGPVFTFDCRIKFYDS